MTVCTASPLAPINSDYLEMPFTARRRGGALFRMTFDELMRHGWGKPVPTEPNQSTPFWASPAFPMDGKVRRKLEAYPEAKKHLPPHFDLRAIEREIEAEIVAKRGVQEPYWKTATFPKCVSEVGPVKLARKRRNWAKLAEKLKKTRVLVWEKTNGHCFYCAIVLTAEKTTIDHYIPRSKGGANHISNYVPACGDCNSSKSDTMPEDFLRRRAAVA